ncbi:carboxymuconolactone decarboxylase family protein [Kribbella capetownensis]|uniref:Carboxymuconolactone decarboxylase family protein n=1 Tax=Kribbella capetownensis TaxID=1572659 RepID=A0A4R0K2Q5_9ACTN|nr:carboxymuconolactone decarboxylase family protein [Kribbella capetownensis]TCC49125.1 carboxymuconolactone decarboxylase family protein [Kribbella capetownensis]
MPRIAPLEPPFDEQSAAAIEALGPPIGLFRLLARCPARARGIQGWGRYYLSRQSALSLRHRELIIDRTTALCGAEYEWGVHVGVFADKAGLTQAQIRSLADGQAKDACWTEPSDRAVIRAVDALHVNSDLDDDEWCELREQLNEDEVVDLLLLCGWYHSISYVARAVRLLREPNTPSLPRVRPRRRETTR